MPIAKIEIVAQKEDASLDDFEWEVEAYLSGLRSNGQIERDWLIEYEGHKATVVCQPARITAHKITHCSRFTRERLAELQSKFGAKPQWEVLIEGGRIRSTSWRKAEFLYLCTNVFDTLYPLNIPGSPAKSIPSYKLPLTERTRADLRHWLDEFQHLDSVWIDSGKLENVAYRELADPRSSFAEKGRELARNAERELAMPVYYFLPRYYGRAVDEEKRPCPSCGEKWRLGAKESERAGGVITFRCVKCRLLSCDAQCTDGRMARIGEFKPRVK